MHTHSLLSIFEPDFTIHQPNYHRNPRTLTNLATGPASNPVMNPSWTTSSENQKRFLTLLPKPCPSSIKSDVQFTQLKDRNHEIDTLLDKILNPDHRPNAIMEMCRLLDNLPELGYIVYVRPGIMAALLLEITRNYPVGEDRQCSTKSLEVGFTISFSWSIIFDKLC